MRAVYCCCFLLLCLVALPVTAQKEWNESDQFRFTDYDRDVAAGLREVQQLMQGREALLRSYQQTDQSYIATEREVEHWVQDRINTEKAGLALAEATVNFQFPNEDDEYEDTIEQSLDESAMNEEIAFWRNQIEANLKSNDSKKPVPPMFYVESLSETSDGIELVISNLGDPVDVLISIGNARSTIISIPYQVEISDFDYSRRVSFKLLARDDQINLLIQTNDGRSHKIPLFIREQIAALRVTAIPFQQSARIGESAEFMIVIEGDPNDKHRHPISIADLPQEIGWQIAKVIPATLPEEQSRSIAIRNISFSNAFSRHQLALQLTLSRDLGKNLIGVPIPFTFRVGSTRESLSITPIGIGEITLDLPGLLAVRLGEEKQIKVHLRNSGTETVNAIQIRSIETIYGIHVKAIGHFSLAAGEQRDVPVTVGVAFDALIGQHNLRLVVQSSAGSQTADLLTEIQPKAMTFASLDGLAMPALVILGIIGAIVGGMKAQQFRQQRAQQRAADYEFHNTGKDD